MRFRLWQLGYPSTLRLDALDVDVNQDDDTFRLSKINDRDYLLTALVEGEWAPQYAFDLSPQEWIDFMPANYLNSTHPDAIFVQKLLIILHDPPGRKILFGDRLKRVVNGKIDHQVIAPEELASILLEQFGLELNS